MKKMLLALLVGALAPATLVAQDRAPRTRPAAELADPAAPVRAVEPRRAEPGDARGGDEARCPGFLDETQNPPNWVCQDDCLEQSDDSVCGQTDHL